MITRLKIIETTIYNTGIGVLKSLLILCSSLSRGLCKYILPRKIVASLASAFYFVLSN